MLELKNIKKDYPAGGDTVHALKGIDLKFRSNEFVSILGPSGCGKTTMLNIVGGLDGYTSGDLVINGKSTKDFKDRDWDTYRNHSIGFVFQSYNLIPHQTVLQNVELALTLSGVGKKERRQRAAAALEEVGLGDQLSKKPAEMSGGQMQRVAIARALVNNPDIMLLDEPTGALDTETGIMVMEILKKVSADRLVIMVTHNPELAEKYSTRIVRMLDGRVVGDTMPLSEEETAQERALEAEKAEAESKKKRPSMKYRTAFGLSLKNLFTKKGRTTLTAFAGSIGIIGIALIYAVSQGTENYIDSVQQDALNSYPLSITTETADMTSMFTGLATNIKASNEALEHGDVAETNVTAGLFGGLGTNDLKSFKKYLDDNYDSVREDINTIQYSYGLTPQIYGRDVNDALLKVNPSAVFSSMGGASSYMSRIFSEMIDAPEILQSQYKILAGKWPENYDEMLFVLSDEHHIPDFMEYGLGMKDAEELRKMMETIMKGETVEQDPDAPVKVYNYEDLMNLDFRLIKAADLYRYNAEYNVWEAMKNDSAYMDSLYENATRLKIVGVVCPEKGASSTSLGMGISYLPSLTAYLMDQAADTQIVKSQLLDTETDVFSGKKFTEMKDAEDSGLDFNNMISVDGDMLSSAFGMKVDTNAVKKFISNSIKDITAQFKIGDTAQAEADFSAAVSTLANGLVKDFYGSAEKVNLASLGVDGWSSAAVLKTDACAGIVSSYLQSEEAKTVIEELNTKYPVSGEGYDAVLNAMFVTTLQSYIANFDKTPFAGLEEPLAALGVDLGAGTALVRECDCDKIVADAAGSALSAAVIPEMAKLMEGSTNIDDIKAEIEKIPGKLTGLLAGSMKVDSKKIASAFQFNMTEEDLMRLMNASSTKGEERSADSNLRSLGYRTLDDPSSIMVYLTDFAGKERFIDFIEDYNTRMKDSEQDEKVIRYTDITGILMSSVKTIVDAIKYVLIAFVSISLVVSSIMIGVITLISVQERTKEIGILRAIGASKKNVSSMFNAETVIIGFISGVIGTGFTFLACFPINALLYKLTELDNLKAVLPWPVALALIAISVMLTLVAGIIPSASAAKKDPVVALRTE